MTRFPTPTAGRTVWPVVAVAGLLFLVFLTASAIAVSALDAAPEAPQAGGEPCVYDDGAQSG